MNAASSIQSPLGDAVSPTASLLDCESLLSSLDQYQRLAARSDQNTRTGVDGLAFPLLGLFGEVGTLLSALKKKQRDKDAYAAFGEEVIEEFGDVLWYLSNIAHRLALSFNDLAADARSDFSTSYSGDVAGSFEAAVISLGGKTGLLLNEFTDRTIAADAPRLSRALSRVFAALIDSAAHAHVDLRDAAQKNLEKINSRWPRSRRYVGHFDDKFPESEQLPRRIEMHILETRLAGKTCVIQLCNGTEVGSPLTDNKFENDDYRFHDVFHLAYAAILGWSPCLRALLRLKRKSDATIDENEDGARAALIEEGIATFVFHHAIRLNYFSSIHSLDYSVLKQVQSFVSGYEVERCPLWQWEEAILKGFEVFRQLRRHRRGVVVADLTERTLTFRPLSDDS